MVDHSSPGNLKASLRILAPGVAKCVPLDWFFLVSVGSKVVQ